MNDPCKCGCPSGASLSLSMGFVCKDCGGYLDVRDILKQRDEARDLLRRAYNEAMDHDIDSRELDEKIKLILRERVLRGEGGE